VLENLLCCDYDLYILKNNFQAAIGLCVLFYPFWAKEVIVCERAGNKQGAAVLSVLFNFSCKWVFIAHFNEFCALLYCFLRGCRLENVLAGIFAYTPANLAMVATWDDGENVEERVFAKTPKP